MPASLMFCYSHADEAMRDRLEVHLALLKRQGLVSTWFDRRIAPGADWDREIDANLEKADILLLLISADFLHSDYCYGVEMKRALERHEAGSARVIPVILKPVDWLSAPIGRLQAVPRDAKPVSRFQDPEEAYHAIALEIRNLLEQQPTAHPVPDPSPARLTAAPSVTTPCLLLVTGSNGIAGSAVLGATRIETADTILLEVIVTDPSESAFLAELRAGHIAGGRLAIAFGTTAAPVDVVEATQRMTGGAETWTLTLRPNDRDLHHPMMEVSTQGQSTDDIAQLRAELILLGTEAPGDSASWGSDQGLVASLVRGQMGGMPVTESPVPGLYRKLGAEPQTCVAVTRLYLVALLILTGTVEHVLRLDVEIRAGEVRIDFEGRRRQAYSNRPAPMLRVRGTWSSDDL